LPISSKPTEAATATRSARIAGMTTPLSPTQLDHAADLIRQADSLIVAAGAGMGVDSGLPDFRGNEGF
jgi:DNA-binding MurR/RpiR family transcriptional regulator